MRNAIVLPIGVVLAILPVASCTPHGAPPKEGGALLEEAPTRAALLDIGWPADDSRGGSYLIGVHVSAEVLRECVRSLEEDGAEVVVLRVESADAALLDDIVEIARVLDEEFESRFRTALWIDMAIGAAAMSTYSVDEIYMTPRGVLGPCSGWPRCVGMAPDLDFNFEDALYIMEQISKRGGRDPKIMRAMQIMEPLSCDTVGGRMVWRQDLEGERIVNVTDRPLTLDASTAVETGVACGIATTADQVLRHMGHDRVSWVGGGARELLAESRHEAADADDRLVRAYLRFENAYARLGRTRPADKAACYRAAAEAIPDLQHAIEARPILARFYGLRPGHLEGILARSTELRAALAEMRQGE